MTSDPIGLNEGDTNNFYVYVANNPLLNIDPLGLYIIGRKTDPVRHPEMEIFLLCLDTCTGKQQLINSTTDGKHSDLGHASGIVSILLPLVHQRMNYSVVLVNVEQFMG